MEKSLVEGAGRIDSTIDHESDWIEKSLFISYFAWANYGPQTNFGPPTIFRGPPRTLRQATQKNVREWNQ